MHQLLENSIRLGGAVHFAILLASAQVPRALDWRGQLALLSPFLRRLFWVYGGFIVLVIVGFGSLSLGSSGEMAAGTPLARALCGFIAIFWLARLGIQLWVFDARPYLTTWFYRWGYRALTLAFVYLTLAYGWAAIL